MTCTSCQQGGNNTSNDANSSEVGNKVTVNDGEGARGSLVISGPLAEVLKEQLDIVFVKRPVLGDVHGSKDNPPPLDLTKISRESHANDVALDALLAEIEAEPDNQIILNNIDVKSIKEHLENAHKGTLHSSELGDKAVINVVAGSIDQLLDGPLMAEVAPSVFCEQHEFILIDKPAENASSMVPVNKASGRVAKLWSESKIVPTDSTSVTDKIASLQRVYGDDLVVHASVEGFVRSIIQRNKK